MFGINDPVIYIGYLLAILSLLACIIYGIMFWNKVYDEDPEALEQDLAWEEKDDEIQNEI